MPIKTGATVRLVQPEIKGRVLKRRITPEDSTEVLVEFLDADGVAQRRWFPEAQLEEAVQ